MCSSTEVSSDKGAKDNLILIQGRNRVTMSLEQMEERRLAEAIEVESEIQDIITAALNGKT